MDKSTLQTMSAIDIKRQDHIWGNSSRPLSICLCLSDCLCLSVCLSLCLCPPYFASPVLADRAKRSLTTTNFVQRSLSVDGRITCNQRSPRQPASLSSTDCSVIFARWRPYVSHLIPSSSDPREFTPPNSITIRSAVFARLTIVTDRQTDKPHCVRSNSPHLALLACSVGDKD